MQHNAKDIEKAWNIMNNIKSEIVSMVDSDNDGIRTNAVLFLEMIVLLQTYPDRTANSSLQPNQGFSLEKIPLTIKFVRRRKLEEEANNMFELLLKYFGSSHISSANLMVCMRCLCNIARQRSHYFEKVISAMSALNRNLPPTLSDSQRTAIKKQLKMLVSNLLKSGMVYDVNNMASELLISLGLSQTDVLKLYSKKRPWNDGVSNGFENGYSKKAKIESIAEELLVDDEDVIIEQDEHELKVFCIFLKHHFKVISEILIN